MNEKSYESKELDRYKIYYNALPDIIRRLGKALGFPLPLDEDAEVPEEDVRGKKSVVIPEPSVGPVIQQSLVSGTSRVLDYIQGTRYYIHNGLLGMNKHVKNDLLFLATTPSLVDEGMVELLSRTTDASGPSKLFAQRQIEKRLTLIGELHKGKPVSLVILGKVEKYEDETARYANFEDYVDYNYDISFMDSSEEVVKFSFEEEKSDKLTLLPRIPSTAYYIPLKPETDEISVSSHTLDTLYKIYQLTIGSNNPILIHCDTGLTHTPKLALAFEILHNYEDIFSPIPTKEIMQKILCIYNDLKRSLSPSIFPQKDLRDLSQAIYLGMALKIVELQKNCTKKLNDIIKIMVSKNDSLKECLGILTAILNDESTNNAVKHLNLTRFMYKYPELAKNPKLLGLFSIGVPDYYIALKELMKLDKQRTQIENELAKVYSPSPEPLHSPEPIVRAVI